MSNIVGFSSLPRTASDSAAGGRHANLKYIDVILPGFKWQTFIFFVSMFDLLVYSWSCAAGPSSCPLCPAWWVLQRFTSYGPDIRQGEVWRLLTPLFLHITIWHVLLNVYFQMLMGFALEQQYGTPKLALLYMVCGLYGNLLSSSSTGYCKYASGASSAAFGLIGVQLMQLILSWHLIQNKAVRIYNLAMFGLLLLPSFRSQHIDQMAHLGGCLAGMVFGVFYEEGMDRRPSWYPFLRWLTMGVAPSLTLLCVLGLFVIPRGCSSSHL